MDSRAAYFFGAYHFGTISRLKTGDMRRFMGIVSKTNFWPNIFAFLLPKTYLYCRPRGCDFS